MDQDSLRQFLVLSRTLHFGRASRACHLSPSALSRSIQRIESEAGCALFERDNRSVSLTAKGRLFQAYAADTLERWEALQEELSQEGGEALSGTLALFATVTACYSLLPRALARFRQDHPRVHLALRTGDAEEALVELEEDRVDIAIAPLPERPSSRLESRVIAEMDVVFVAPTSAGEVSRKVERRSIPWKDVPLILPQFGLARRYADRWLRAKRIRPRIESEVAGHEAILSLVALGCGVGIVPQLVLEKSPLRSEVRILDVRPKLPRFRVGFCVKRARLEQPLLAAFWESTGATLQTARGAAGSSGSS